MATLKLTARQRQVFDFVQHEIAHAGFPPTRAEIARALGFKSANAAEDHLRALARKGAIELTANASRGIRLMNAGAMAGVMPPMASAAPGTAARVQFGAHGGEPHASYGALARLLLPIIGHVAAGSPVLAAEHIEREVDVEASLFIQAPDYLLRVRGSSMRNAGILDGDLLAVKKAADARSGQIIVARLGDDVTVKRLLRSGREITLLPENADFAPIPITQADDFHLEGIAVASRP